MKPLLAHRENPILENLTWPKLGSPKFDGIRTLRPKGDVRLHTRKLKLVPNINVRERFCQVVLDGVDGELIVGDPTDPLVYQATQSVVMSFAPPKPADDVRLFLFDTFLHPEYSYERRLDMLHGLTLPPHVLIVDQHVLKGPRDALRYEEELVEMGYEGMMLRDPRGVYKYGRSTLDEEILLKFKRVEDSDAYITGFEEQMENTNPAKENELGYMKRSKKQAGMKGKGTLGVIIGYDPRKKWVVRVGMGPGLTDELRAHIWSIRHELLKKKSWFKYRWTIAGTKDLPRSPRFMGLGRRDT